MPVDACTPSVRSAGSGDQAVRPAYACPAEPERWYIFFFFSSCICLLNTNMYYEFIYLLAHP